MKIKRIEQEECDCGNNIQHDSGGNYHYTYYEMDNGEEYSKSSSIYEYCSKCGRYVRTPHHEEIDGIVFDFCEECH